MTEAFRDRLDAGEHLATALASYRGTESLVLGMARGGVAVGYAVARKLDLPLHALVVRKIGAPQNPELAIGAVSETGSLWLDQAMVAMTGASDEYVRRETDRQVEEARRRQEAYGVGGRLDQIRGRTVIVTDDGIATGASALVAVRSSRNLGAARVVLAAPVASRQAVGFLRRSVDDLVVLATPDSFHAVGMYYGNFDQVTDDEVVAYLEGVIAPEAPG